jgi:hypothetical protein
MESLGELDRLVATVVRVVKTGRTGKRVGTSCSRIDTDKLGVFDGRLRAWADAVQRESDSSLRSAGRFVAHTCGQQARTVVVE